MELSEELLERLLLLGGALQLEQQVVHPEVVSNQATIMHRVGFAPGVAAERCEPASVLPSCEESTPLRTRTRGLWLGLWRDDGGAIRKVHGALCAASTHRLCRRQPATPTYAKRHPP